MRIAVCGPATLSMLQEFVDQPMRSRGYPFPGTSELIIEYLTAGHTVVLITTAIDIHEPMSFSGEKLEIRIVPSRRRARYRAMDLFASERAGIKSALLDSNVDVVHAHWTYEFAIASRSSKIPSLVTVHDWGPTVAYHNKRLYWYVRALMQIWCLLIPGELSAPTSYLAQKIRRFYRRECQIIPNGVDLREAAKQSSGSVAGTVGMLNVGFTEGKNVRSALLAWRIIWGMRPDCKLYLAGPDYEIGGPAHLWAMANNCDSGVIFEGPIGPAERTSWYGRKEIFLHTSREESFGLVLIEAMAAMIPVIAGKSSGAVPEITRGAARLIDINDPVEIASHLMQLMDDGEERGRLSSMGIQVARQYDRVVVAEKYLSTLHRLSGNKAILPGPVSGGSGA